MKKGEIEAVIFACLSLAKNAIPGKCNSFQFSREKSCTEPAELR